MGKIYCLIGKSASGKDTIYARLLKDNRLGLKKYVIYTTRPKRPGEHEGDEYFFTTEEQMEKFESSDRFIEKRVYHTVFGDWYYFSVDYDGVDLAANSYLYIATLESFIAMRNYYGADKVVPVYIEVPNEVRLERAIKRDSGRGEPAFDEIKRRFAADEIDFSEEKIEAAGIERRFTNIDIESCIGEITETFWRKSRLL